MSVDLTPPAEAVDTPHYPIACLGTEPGSVTWFEGDLDGLEGIAWESGGTTPEPASLDAWVAAARDVVVARETPRVHLLATGAEAHGALVLATRHPDLVASVLLGDPAVDPATPGYADQLAQVRAPTLVIASAPDPGHVTDQAQSIAGGIVDGVFVIIDGARVPAHRERGSSFNEWAVAFTVIAEGLVAAPAATAPVPTDSQEDDRA